MKFSSQMALVVCAFSVLSCKVRDEGAQLASVGGYNCNPDEPPPVEKEIYNEPTLSPNFALVHPERRPLIFYYAVDTEEPFIQFSVDQDLRELRQVCKLHPNLGIFAAVNSHFSKSGSSYFTCRNGAFAAVAYPDSLQKILLGKIATTTASNMSYSDRSGELWSEKLRYNIRFPIQEDDENSREIIESIQRYPFSHPDFFAVMFDFMRKNFPPTEHTYFVHIKSHGSDSLLLSGLTSQSRKEKVECQEKLLDSHPMNEGGKGIRPRFAYGEVGLEEEAPSYQEHITMLGLGDILLMDQLPLGELYIDSGVESEAIPLGEILSNTMVGDKVLAATFLSDLILKSEGSGAIGETQLGSLYLGNGVRLGLLELRGPSSEGTGIKLGEYPIGEGRKLGDVRLGDVRLGSKAGVSRLGDIRLGDVRLGDVRLGSGAPLGKGVRLGDVRLDLDGQGLGNVNDGIRLGGGRRIGSVRLGYVNGLGHTGLGLTGLSIENHYGMPSMAINAVLVDLFRNYGVPSTDLGFIFFESCDSKVTSKQQIAQHLLEFVPELKAYYSAIGSLWFRNIDYNTLTNMASYGSSLTSTSLQNAYVALANSVVNYVPNGQ